MKKVLYIIFFCLIIFLMFVLQINVIANLNLFGVKPNLLLVSCIFVSLTYGLYKGTIYSFIIGIIADLIYGNSFGIFLISFILTSIAIGYFNKNYFKEGFISLLGSTVFGTVVYEFTFFIIKLFTLKNISITFLIKSVCISSVLNIALMIMCNAFFEKIMSNVIKEIKE